MEERWDDWHQPLTLRFLEEHRSSFNFMYSISVSLPLSNCARWKPAYWGWASITLPMKRRFTGDHSSQSREVNQKQLIRWVFPTGKRFVMYFYPKDFDWPFHL